MNCNYKVKMKDIQNKYKFKIFCAGYEYDDTEIRNEISQRALISEAGRYVELELNPNTYVLTAKLKDKNNNLISTSTPIDLPLESMIVNATYDSTTKSLIITLQNGNTTSIPLGDLIDGLATEEDLNEVRDNLEVVQNELNQYKTIYNVLPKVNGSGEVLTLSDTGNATLKIDLKGNTSQDGTPTPDYPQEIQVVTGDNTIIVSNSDNTQSQSYPVSLGNIELCKIGNYKDRIYPLNGKWYLEKNIGKVVLDGSEVWIVHGGIASWFYYDGIIDGYVLDNTQVLIKTNYYTPKAYQGVPNLVNGECSYGSSDGGITHRFVIKNTDYTQVQDFKNWLSTHNTIVYYVLATPTTEEITDSTLISQLEEIKEAESYSGQTNISQTNDDKPFILTATALKDLSSL